MRALLIVLAGVGVLIAGCGGYVREVEILRELPIIKNVRIGRITANYETASTVIKNVLEIELAKRNLVISDNSKWTLSGDTDASTRVFSALFQLTDEKKQPYVTWWYWDNDLLLLSARRSPNKFAVYMAGQISSTLKE